MGPKTRRNGVLSACTFCLLLATCNCSGCSDLKVTYDSSKDCQGKKGTNFILSTLDNTTRTACVEYCEKLFKCMLFFYNTKTGYCSLHSKLLPDIGMTHYIDTDCFFMKNAAESWITEITHASQSASGNPASAMIGPQDGIYWAQTNSNQQAYLTVLIASEMYIEQITVYEVDPAGGIGEISFLTPDGDWYPVWTSFVWSVNGLPPLEPNLEITYFRTSRIRFTVGIRVVPEKIDAVKVTGRYEVSTKRTPAP